MAPDKKEEILNIVSQGKKVWIEVITVIKEKSNKHYCRTNWWIQIQNWQKQKRAQGTGFVWGKDLSY